MRLLKGKPVADKIDEKSLEIIERKKNNAKCLTPSLLIVRAGIAVKQGQSDVYVNMKVKKARKLGINSKVISLDIAKADHDKMMNELSYIVDCEISNNIRSKIVMQMPICAINKHNRDYSNMVSSSADVDCLSAKSMGYFYSTQFRSIDDIMKSGHNIPATPMGIMCMLDYYDVKITGKKAVVVGRSDIVGKPVAKLLTDLGATVSICSSETPFGLLVDELKSADIAIIAIGKPKYFKGVDFKDDCVIIDVGTSIGEDGKLCGDVDISSISEKSNISITPVPGGVGPCTVSSLIYNVVK